MQNFLLVFPENLVSLTGKSNKFDIERVARELATFNYLKLEWRNFPSGFSVEMLCSIYTGFAKSDRIAIAVRPARHLDVVLDALIKRIAESNVNEFAVPEVLLESLDSRNCRKRSLLGNLTIRSIDTPVIEVKLLSNN